MDEVESIARRCYLKLKCDKCGNLIFIEFFKPAFRSKWYVKSSWVESPVWVDFKTKPKTKKKQKQRRKKEWSD